MKVLLTGCVNSVMDLSSVCALHKSNDASPLIFPH